MKRIRQRQLPGACVEKAWSGELGGDWKDRWEENERASETEVSGQLRRSTTTRQLDMT